MCYSVLLLLRIIVQVFIPSLSSSLLSRRFLGYHRRLIGHFVFSVPSVVYRAYPSVIYRGRFVRAVRDHVRHECLGRGVQAVHTFFGRPSGSPSLSFGSARAVRRVFVFFFQSVLYLIAASQASFLFFRYVSPIMWPPKNVFSGCWCVPPANVFRILFGGGLLFVLHTITTCTVYNQRRREDYRKAFRGYVCIPYDFSTVRCCIHCCVS